MTDGHELKIPHPPDWARERVDALFGFVSRGTAPVYVEHSSTYAIGQRCVTEQGFSASRARPHSVAHLDGVVQPRRGDLLLNSTGTGTIGRSCLFDQDGDFIVDGHVTLLQPLVQCVDSRWFDAVLRSSWGQSFLQTRCYSGSTNQVELSKSLLCSATVPVPPLVEQRKISKLLGLVTEAIGSTEQIVEKLKLAKQGLLHNLLTRGIDDNGELRDPTRNPEQFKDSSLGLIPRTWELHPLHSCLVGGPTNGLYKPAREIGRGTILVGQTSFTDDYLVDWTAVRRANVSLAEKSYYGLREGDILVSRVFATVAGVGLPVRVANMIEEAVFESNMMRLRANPQQVMVRFLLEALLSHTTRRFISAGANASNQASVNQQMLNAIPLLLPPPAEQIGILSIVEEAERRLHQETVSASKLRLVKQGLAEDLLTGRVRVTPLLEKDSSP